MLEEEILSTKHAASLHVLNFFAPNIRYYGAIMDIEFIRISLVGSYKSDVIDIL